MPSKLRLSVSFVCMRKSSSQRFLNVRILKLLFELSFTVRISFMLVLISTMDDNCIYFVSFISVYKCPRRNHVFDGSRVDFTSLAGHIKHSFGI